MKIKNDSIKFPRGPAGGGRKRGRGGLPMPPVKRKPLKFRIGQRVRYVGKLYKSIGAAVGTIIEITISGDFPYRVKFGEAKIFPCAQTELSLADASSNWMQEKI